MPNARENNWAFSRDGSYSDSASGFSDTVTSGSVTSGSVNSGSVTASSVNSGSVTSGSVNSGLVTAVPTSSRGSEGTVSRGSKGGVWTRPGSSPGLPPLFAVGESVGDRYRIERFIARGGMGEVYEAEDLGLGGRVALKTIRPQVARDEKALERFRREIFLSRRVTHPNVCRIYDVFRHRLGPMNASGAESEILFLTMELLRGETLADRLRREGRISTVEALPLVRQMAAALAAAHAAGVIHRDFKSRNVLLIPGSGPDAETRVVVTDFGLASARDADMSFSFSLTGSGDMLGTPAYMAPEQVEGGEVNSVSDIYALGVVLYEMVTGAKPFVGESPLATAIKRLTEPPPSPRGFVPDLDPRWESVIRRCLERQPEDRFATAAEVIAALEGQPVLPSRRLQRRRQRWMVVGGILVGLSLTAGSWWGWQAAEGYRTGLLAETPTPEQRRNIAVLGFKNLTGDPRSDWLSIALAEMLSTELGIPAGAASASTLRVIPGENVARLKLEMGWSDVETLAEDSLAKVRESLGADFVVMGTTLLLGTGERRQIRLDLRLQDARNGEMLASLTETGTEDQLFDLVSRVGLRLRDRLGVGQGRAKDGMGGLSMLPTGSEATRLYLEGLAKLRLFDGLAAKSLLEQAVAADPQQALSHWGLSQTWALLGYDAKAKDEARQAFELGADLPRESKLILEGRFHEVQGQWAKAVETYQVLTEFDPHNLEYGLLLAKAQCFAGKGKAAFSTLEALHRLPPPAGEDPRIDVTEAEVAEAMSEYSRQQIAAVRALTKGKAQGSQALVAHARIWEGLALWNLGESAKAAAAFEEARRIFAESGELRGAARVMRFIAAGLANGGHQEEARALFEEALRGFREIGDRNGMQWTLNSLAGLTFEQGDLQETRTLLEEALSLSREIGAPGSIARALQSLANVLVAEGRLADGRQRAEEALALFRLIGEQRGEATTKLRLARIAWYEADLLRARTLVSEALQSFRQMGHKSSIALCLDLIAQIHVAQDELAKAHEALSEALALREMLNARGGVVETRLSLADLNLEEEHPIEAEAKARLAAEEAKEQGRPDREAWAQSVLARSLYLQKRPEEAVAAAVSALELAEGELPLGLRLDVRIAASGVLASQGTPQQVAEAVSRLENLRVEANAAGFARAALQAGLALGQARRQIEPTESVRALLTEVGAEAANRGFQRLASQAQQAANF